jgi:RNA polymerase sigma-70 factor (ECF subfamily)
MPEHPLRTLIAACSCHETDSFRQLYEIVQPKVFAFVSYRTTTREQAIDVSQDILVELHQALPTFVYHSDAEFFGFVFTITRRALARHYAHKHTKASCVQSDVELDEIAPMSTESELVLLVRQALEKLDAAERDIIVLHHWSRYTFGEIGVMVNMTEGAVRTKHHRARTKLAHLLDVTS